jgi:hypothetical protein
MVQFAEQKAGAAILAYLGLFDIDDHHPERDGIPSVIKPF